MRHADARSCPCTYRSQSGPQYTPNAGDSTDIETTNPKSTQKVELEVQQDDMVLKTIKGDANGLILVCERPHEGELEV
jgi:hypothetical protein